MGFLSLPFMSAGGGPVQVVVAVMSRALPLPEEARGVEFAAGVTEEGPEMDSEVDTDNRGIIFGVQERSVTFGMETRGVVFASETRGVALEDE